MTPFQGILFMVELRQIEHDILAIGKVEGEELEVLRKRVYVGGQIRVVQRNTGSLTAKMGTRVRFTEDKERLIGSLGYGRPPFLSQYVADDYGEDCCEDCSENSGEDSVGRHDSPFPGPDCGSFHILPGPGLGTRDRQQAARNASHNIFKLRNVRHSPPEREGPQ